MRIIGTPVRVAGLLCAVAAGLAFASPAIASPAVAAPTTADSQSAPSSVSKLPQPTLAVTGISVRASGGTTYIEADLSVTNYASFPDELFAQAPDLPACGLNTSASRTWVDIYNGQNNQRIYGFCALGKAKDMTGLWFAVPVTTGLPSSVYVRLDDRRTGTTYQSNTVAIR